MGANFQSVRSATAAQANNSAWDHVVNNIVQDFPGAPSPGGGAPAPSGPSASPVAPLGTTSVPSPLASAVGGVQAQTQKRSLLG
jgi:hypothetical protein